MSTENPYSAPTVDPILEQVPGTDSGLVLATLSERFAGAFLDGLINLVIIAPIWFVLITVGVVANFQEIGQAGPLLSISMGVVAFILFIVVQYIPLSQSGQTWGKRVMKTRIVTMSGQQPQLMDLVLKRYGFFNLVGLIPFVGGLISLVSILMIFKKDRRCLHDLIAGTQVVKVAPAPLA